MQPKLNQFFGTSKAVVRPGKDVVHMGSRGGSQGFKPNLFDRIPIEMNQRIAEYIEDDDDLGAFLQACRSTHDAVEGDKMSFWRRRFLARYEGTRSRKSNAQYKALYIARKKRRDYGSTFGYNYGYDPDNVKCLKLLRDVILDSYSDLPGDAHGRMAYDALNLDYLIAYVRSEKGVSILDTIFDPRDRRPASASNRLMPPSRLMQTIQILLTPLLLRLDYPTCIFSFPQSQVEAYEMNPIFSNDGRDINMPWLLHQINYWRYHLCRSQEITLFRAYEDEPEKPRLWMEQLSNSSDATPGRYWKGAFGFVHENDIRRIRDFRNSEGLVEEHFCGREQDGDFQELVLEPATEGNDAWSELFADYLKALERPKAQPKTRSQRRTAEPSPAVDDWDWSSFHFQGRGFDENEDFSTEGWLTSLPSQEGIPGWKRMKMMKYQLHEDGNMNTNVPLWGYDGIVLPGGQIIVGRWFDPHSTAYSGPFFMWCVDAPHLLEKEEEQMRKREEAAAASVEA